MTKIIETRSVNHHVEAMSPHLARIDCLPCPVAARVARTHTRYGGSAAIRTQKNPQRLPLTPGMPESLRALHPVGERLQWGGLDRPTKPKEEASGNCGNALIGESLEKRASDGGPCLSSQMALMAVIRHAVQCGDDSAADCRRCRNFSASRDSTSVMHLTSCCQRFAVTSGARSTRMAKSDYRRPKKQAKTGDADNRHVRALSPCAARIAGLWCLAAARGTRAHTRCSGSGRFRSQKNSRTILEIPEIPENPREPHPSGESEERPTDGWRRRTICSKARK